MSKLIKVYGELWNPDIIDWGSRGAGNKGKLEGKIRVDNSNKIVDCWDAEGIYVLYDNFKSIYVGKAFKTSMGKRLRDHLTDRLVGRWDMFSFYSTSHYRKTKNDLKPAATGRLNPETIINTLEALAILIADPALNRKRETLKDAHRVNQSDSVHPQTIRNYLEQILDHAKRIP